jgi:hypothetical protein
MAMPQQLMQHEDSCIHDSEEIRHDVDREAMVQVAQVHLRVPSELTVPEDSTTSDSSSESVSTEHLPRNHATCG